MKRSYPPTAMHIPHRLLRAHADAMPINHRVLSEKERAREHRILATAQHLMARFCREAVTMRGLADALRMAPATIRRHFIDIDSILAEILVRHLRAIAQAITQAADRRAARSAYLAATRTSDGRLTEAHHLLLRERHTLPPDFADTVEQLGQHIASLLGGPKALVSLLDNPNLQAGEIEAMLAPPPPALPAPGPAPADATTRTANTQYRDLKLAKRFKSFQAQQARASPACNSP